jgi:ParB family chromosome partitioning protein
MVAKKRGLGRGLDALLGSESRPEAAGTALEEIPVEWITPGKYQPRKNMDESGLSELAASIRAQGVMQPIVVRRMGEGRFEIIAGERRWRATQLAGLDRIPAVIRDVSDESAVAISLIENIQREDLNPMEEALALQRLIDEFDLTHQQVADAVGISRTAVTNFLRLLNLDGRVAGMLARGEIEMGHARALLGLPDDHQLAVARDIAARGLSVRQTEAMVRRALSRNKVRKPSTTDADTRQLESRLSMNLGQPVTIQHTARGKGKLIIKYNSLDELDGILSRFGDLE